MKILIIRLSSLGDIILTQPVCAILQGHYPQAEITLVCKPAFAPLPVMFDPPVRVMHYQESAAFFLALRREHYDLVIDLHGKLASWLIRIFARADKRLGYNKKRSVRKAIVQGNKLLSIPSTVSLYASILPKLGIAMDWVNPRLKTYTKPKLSDSPIQIAIFPGASHFSKRYPLQSWIELIKLHPGIHFCLLGSSADLDTCREIQMACPDNCENLAARFGLADLCQELQRYDLIISGDTGPMHMAAALTRPQIAIFGGTHPRLGFAPMNKLATVLCANLDCQPCSLHGLPACPKGHFNCMRQISPQLISSAIKQILSK